ncbi:chymotrypsin-C-like [Aphidius gifuensis]|uniref:chymotrypsin-C-like n=1 Tax=Aphidius gifuensis TaxID=684658 RepID=UPI001CDC404C|nr:chymotrypsin-C-like [Aphidius gifuensis]
MILSFITCLNIIISVVYGNLSSKIYGGETSTIYSHPHQVSIQLHDYHTCSGSIISNRHILTAATCVTSEQNVYYGNIQVLSGTNDLMRQEEHSKIHRVAYIILHEQYNPYVNWMNDIAILVLEKQIPLLMGIRAAVCMPPQKTSSNSYYTTGWGINPSTKIISRYLQQIHVKSISSGLCQKKYYKFEYLYTTQHCFIPLLSTSGISQGSAGSPVMFGRKIVGIISLDSLDIRQPIIYTHVFEYINWIEQMKEKI